MDILSSTLRRSISGLTLFALLASTFGLALLYASPARANEAQECTENAAQVIVSDTATQVDAHDAVAVTPNGAWTTISGATWIHSEALDANGTSPTGSKTFTRTFTITDTPTDSSLEIAADNMYTVSVNGNPLTTGTSGTDLDNFSASDTWTIPAASLLQGSNTITIVVTNPANDPANDQPFGDPNPAGLNYRLTVNSKHCETPEPENTATVVATKIVCDTEASLPNWGAGGPDISSTTAANFVAASNGMCHLASGWNFQWAPNGTANPGDAMDAAGSPWTTFGPTVAGSVSTAVATTSDKVWVREQMQAGYIPFTGVGGSNVSAEMYCNKDVLNYDNYDFITPVVAGQTYYCVAFNVASSTPPPATVKVTIVKYVDGVHATAASSSNTIFPMSATWNSTSTGSGSGSFNLSSSGFNTANPYEAVTADMTTGASYSASETMGATVSTSTCSTSSPPYQLVGYSSGDTLAAAQAAAPTTTMPSFTNLLYDKYVIVWNHLCSNTSGDIGGTVEDHGVLKVTSIDSVDTSASADNTYENGWKYVFHITVPDNELSVSMKFSDWLAGSSTIPVANNMRISSAQSSNPGPITLTGANVYSSPAFNINADLDLGTPGKQILVTVEVKIPTGTSNGSYTTTYGVQSLP